jgi:hypothetical protein
MYVDGYGPYSGTALGRFQGLDLVEPLYVGGVPDFRNIHRLNGFTRGFVGRLYVLCTITQGRVLFQKDKRFQSYDAAAMPS